MFKNKAEREKFLREYKEWQEMEIGDYDYRSIRWHEVKIDFYRYKFKNGATVIVTERPQTMETRYNLIIPEGDSYNPWDQNSGRTPSEFRGYNLTGVSVGTIVDYMTKRKEEI